VKPKKEWYTVTKSIEIKPIVTFSVTAAGRRELERAKRGKP